jgi:peptidoglycan/LPS O-acetylase OafA/YrhL
VFGIFRLLLATFVLIGHLPASPLKSPAHDAVFAFFLLSGYLMTLVLNETYGFSYDGIRRFLVNRALRIYPPYFAALALALLLFAIRRWTNGTPIPWLDNVPDYVSQVLLLDVPGVQHARWIIPSWSLNVEVGFYVAMVVLARRRSFAIAWVLFSLALLGRMLWTGESFLGRYFTYAGASLPFSLGSLLCHLRDRLPRATPAVAVGAVTVFAAHALVEQWLWRDPSMEGLYASVVLAVIVVAALRDGRALGAGPRLRRIDARCGDLAYPLFLCHHPIVLATAAMLPLRLAFRDAWASVLATLLSFLAAWLLHRGVETPIARWRDRIRPAARRGPAPAAARTGAGDAAPLARRAAP